MKNFFSPKVGSKVSVNKIFFAKCLFLTESKTSKNQKIHLSWSLMLGFPWKLHLMTSSLSLSWGPIFKQIRALGFKINWFFDFRENSQNRRNRRLISAKKKFHRSLFQNLGEKFFFHRKLAQKSPWKNFFHGEPVSESRWKFFSPKVLVSKSRWKKNFLVSLSWVWSGTWFYL